MNLDLSYFVGVDVEHIIAKKKGITSKRNVKPNKVIKSFKGRVTLKSTTKFVMHEYKVHVEHNGKIYKIENFKPIENNCLLFPTSINNMQNKPQYFSMLEDKFKDRIEVIDAFWSRYDFTKIPLIKEVLEDSVILEE